MNRRCVFLSLFFLLCTAAVLPAWGNREKVNIVRVTGTVRLVGNEPFTEIVISNSDDVWYIPRDERAKLTEYQHRTVTVEGEETVTELKFANGLSAGTRRELRNIRIISSQ